MATISARDASRGFSTLLDRVEQAGEEFTIIRDGKVVARVVPATTRTVGDFLARRAQSQPVDDDFAADALSATSLLTAVAEDPWRD